MDNESIKFVNYLAENGMIDSENVVKILFEYGLEKVELSIKQETLIPEND